MLKYVDKMPDIKSFTVQEYARLNDMFSIVEDIFKCTSDFTKKEYQLAEALFTLTHNTKALPFNVQYIIANIRKQRDDFDQVKA